MTKTAASMSFLKSSSFVCKQSVAIRLLITTKATFGVRLQLFCSLSVCLSPHTYGL
jgi:hypothetical protein